MKIKKSAVLWLGMAAIAAAGTYELGQKDEKADDIAPAQSSVLNKNAKNTEIGSKALPNSKDFDFYVLSLSWSPTYCLNNSDTSEQCSNNHEFVVHGLWPQYEQGYPRECSTNFPAPKADTINNLSDIMPSHKLVKTQWFRHGSCTGFSSDEYFKILRAAYNKIKIPQITNNPQSAGEIESAFMNNNDGLKNNMIAVTTKDGLLSEVRICLTQQLEFRSCPQVDKAAARETYQLKVPSSK